MVNKDKNNVENVNVCVCERVRERERERERERVRENVKLHILCERGCRPLSKYS